MAHSLRSTENIARTRCMRGALCNANRMNTRHYSEFRNVQYNIVIIDVIRDISDDAERQ